MLTAVQPLEPSPDDDSLDFTNTLTLQVRKRQADKNLPDNFDDFNAKIFIEEAYGLATQI